MAEYEFSEDVRDEEMEEDVNNEVNLSYDGEDFRVPKEMMEDEDIFQSVVSNSTWKEVLSEEDREKLIQLLPPGTQQQREDNIQDVLKGDNIWFGNPVTQAWTKINSGVFCPELREACQELEELRYQQYQHNQKRYYMKLLQDILISRQELMQKALLTGSLEDIHTSSHRCLKRRRRQSSLERRAEIKYRRMMQECREEWGEGQDVTSSDEDIPTTNQIADDVSPPISEEEYRKMLRRHHERQMRRKMEQDLVAKGLNVTKTSEKYTGEKQNNIKSDGGSTVLGAGGSGGNASMKDRTSSPADFTRPPPSGGRRGRGRGRIMAEETTRPRASAESKAVHDAYGPIEDGSRVEPTLTPIILNKPMAKYKFQSFFSLLKHAFDALHDRKGEIGKVTKSVKTIINSPDVEGCLWLERRSDWIDLILPALMYLATEVGAVSSFDPLPFFFPVVEFRDRIDHWKWMGHDRDSELELLVLCNHWMENLDRALEIVDYSDYKPPTPINMWTNFLFRPSTTDEVARFREQEAFRYSQPFKSYTYDIHGFEAAIGPVKGARTYKKDSGSRARGHALLIPDRPNCVTILSIVRDAASRLPDGEGTRVDLCVVVRDSQFIHEHVTDMQLNNAVSGALDRLHYEKDPCVRYDSTRKVWIYLHRGRSEEDFEHIQWACDMAAKQKKMITSRPRVKPRILLRDPEKGGEEVVLMEGGPQTTPITTSSGNSGTATSGRGEGGGGGGKTGRRTAGKTGNKSGGVKSTSTPSSITTTGGGGGGVGSVMVTSVMGEPRGGRSLSPASSVTATTSSPSPRNKHRKSQAKTKKKDAPLPLLSVVQPPSALKEGGEWNDLPFLTSLQSVGVSGGHESSSSWQSSDDELTTKTKPTTINTDLPAAITSGYLHQDSDSD